MGSVKDARNEIKSETKEEPKKPGGRSMERGKRANRGFDLDDMFEKDNLVVEDRDKPKTAVAKSQHTDSNESPTKLKMSSEAAKGPSTHD